MRKLIVQQWVTVDNIEDVPVAVEFRDGGPGVIVTSLRR
jgi:hypothetical protein